MSKLNPLKCANHECRMELFNAKSVDMLHIPPKVDDLVVCGNCGNVSKVTLEGTKLITKDEFNKLSVEEKADLTFGARAITKNLRSN